MALNDTILKDMTTAMKEQDKFNLSVLRMLKSALQLEKINLKHDLTDEEVTALRNEVDKQIVEGDLRREVQMNIKNKMEINSYQGTRHKKGLPVHGQRTSRNARTRKGKGKVVANKKKA